MSICRGDSKEDAESFEFYSASYARNLTNNSMWPAICSQLNNIDSKIAEACISGKTQAVLENNISEFAIEKLKKAGYSIDMNGNNTLTISW